MTTKTKVIIAEDYALTLAGIRQGLMSDDSIQIVSECQTSDSIIPSLLATDPDILLLDLKMPNGSGGSFEPISGIKKIRVECPTVKIVVISAYLNPTILRENLASDIRGYILKDDLAPEQLPEIIHTVMKGRLFISKTVRNHYKKERRLPSLTDRQTEILKALAANLDLGLEVLAEQLSITSQSLRNQLGNIYKEMGAANKTHCIALAMAFGIIPPPDYRDIQ
jgi:DNA-binding NarL/FixJ family response regulator